jgi:hypothetical protein
MANRFFLIILLGAWLGSSKHCISMEPMSPVQILERATLTEDVTLGNSPEIYLKVAGLFDRKGVIKISAPDITAADVDLAWANDQATNAKVFGVMLRKGSSIVDVIQQIADRRGEVLIKKTNFIIIKPSTTAAYQGSYQEEVGASKSNATEKLVSALIPSQISLLQFGGVPMEQFINIKMREGWGDANPLTFKMDEGARLEVGKVSIIGRWTYRDLLNAMCALTDLHWRIDGKTLWLEKSKVNR